MLSTRLCGQQGAALLWFLPRTVRERYLDTIRSRDTTGTKGAPMAQHESQGEGAPWLVCLPAVEGFETCEIQRFGIDTSHASVDV